MLWKCLWIISSNSVEQHVFLSTPSEFHINLKTIKTTRLPVLLRSTGNLLLSHVCQRLTFKYISQCSFEWLQVSVTEKITGVYFLCPCRSAVNLLSLHYVKDRVCLMRQKQSGFLTSADFQNTGKKSIQPTSTVYWISARCAPYWGISTVDSLFHNITMDWGSFCRIKKNSALFHQLNKGRKKKSSRFPFLARYSFHTTSFYSVWHCRCELTEFKGHVKFSRLLKTDFQNLYNEIFKDTKKINR